MRMDTQKAFRCALFAALIHVLMVKAQIPRPCANEYSIISRKCCPRIPGSFDRHPCGQDRQRGACVNITSVCNQFSSTYKENDVRYNWPHYFTQGCRCNGNFGGYDCGDCKFGWKGDDCKEKESKPRRPIASILHDGSAEWNDYKDTLYKAKDTFSTRYVVLTKDAIPGDDDAARAAINSKKDITIYNLFVWYHHYVAKENVYDGRCGKSIDYAHEKTGFLTWHRLFLLWFEREIQIEFNKPNFRLYYWDWRNTSDIDRLLRAERFGGIGEGGKVEGNFGDWKSVCWEKPPTLSNCNPDATCHFYTLHCNVLSDLLRCNTRSYCSSSHPQWPSHEDVSVALGKNTFDSYPYNVKAPNGLRNYLEGFKPVSTCEVGGPFCDGVCGERHLHNSVHLLLGNGGGVMANLAASPNDPLFLNHHTMIDCIFEEWLKGHSTADYPEDTHISSSEYRGHRVDDCIVPFYPLYTHRDMFKKADTFGYSCDLNAASRIVLYSTTILLACVAAFLLQ